MIPAIIQLWSQATLKDVHKQVDTFKIHENFTPRNFTKQYKIKDKKEFWYGMAVN